MNVKIKLSALWAAIMFLYIYVDYFHLFQPGAIEEISAGMVWKFEITQVFLLSALIFIIIPSLMIFLSLSLPAQANRWTNIIVAVLLLLVAIANPIGESWAFVYLGSAVEIVLFALIIRYAWKWPNSELGPR